MSNGNQNPNFDDYEQKDDGPVADLGELPNPPAAKAERDAGRSKPLVTRREGIAGAVGGLTALALATGISQLATHPQSQDHPLLRAGAYIDAYRNDPHAINLALQRAIDFKDLEAAEVLAEQFIKARLPVFHERTAKDDTNTAIENWVNAASGYKNGTTNMVQAIGVVEKLLAWSQEYGSLDAALLAGKHAFELENTNPVPQIHDLFNRVMDQEIALGSRDALMAKAEARARYAATTQSSSKEAKAAVADALSAKQQNLQGSIESYAIVLHELAHAQPHDRKLLGAAIDAWEAFYSWVKKNDTGQGVNPDLLDRRQVTPWDTSTADMFRRMQESSLFLAAGDYKRAEIVTRPFISEFIPPKNDIADYQDAIVGNHAEALLGQTVDPDDRQNVDIRKIQQALDVFENFRRSVRAYYKPRGYDQGENLLNGLINDIDAFKGQVEKARRDKTTPPTWEESQSDQIYGFAVPSAYDSVDPSEPPLLITVAEAVDMPVLPLFGAKLTEAAPARTDSPADRIEFVDPSEAIDLSDTIGSDNDHYSVPTNSDLSAF